MAFNSGDYVLVRGMLALGKLKIVGIEWLWRGCVEYPSVYKLKTAAGVINIQAKDVLTKQQAVAERLKGDADGFSVGV